MSLRRPFVIGAIATLGFALAAPTLALASPPAVALARVGTVARLPAVLSTGTATTTLSGVEPVRTTTGRQYNLRLHVQKDRSSAPPVKLDLTFERRSTGPNAIAVQDNDYSFGQEGSTFSAASDLSSATFASSGLGAYGSVQLSFEAHTSLQDVCTTGDPRLLQSTAGIISGSFDVDTNAAKIGAAQADTLTTEGYLTVDHGCPAAPPPPAECPGPFATSASSAETTVTAGQDDRGRAYADATEIQAIAGLALPASLTASVSATLDPDAVTFGAGPSVHIVGRQGSFVRGQAVSARTGPRRILDPLPCGNGQTASGVAYEAAMTSPSDGSKTPLTFSPDALDIVVPRAPGGLQGELDRYRVT